MASPKREQLLASAERLFDTRGFHATGIDEIVQAAGVVRMTLYNQFGSKDALVQAVLDARHARFLDRLDAAVDAAEPGAATAALVEAHSAWLAEHGARGCILVRAMGEFAAHSQAIHARAVAKKTDLRARIHHALAKDGCVGDGLVDRVFLVLEGANNAVPVLGAATVAAQTRRAVADLLTSPGETPA